MKRWSVLAAAVCLILCTLTLSAAAVNTTKEPTSGKTVYVAGNPDLYPVEYYNPKTDAYEGMLPQLYAELSETTGIQFSYIRAGALNQQSRLAKNLQVELVSAHIRGTVPQLQEQYVLLSFDIDGEKTDVCVGFTSIADESMCNAVINRLNAISHEELLSLSLQVASSRKQENSLWLVISIAVLSVATVVLIAVLIHGRVQRKKASQDVLVDSVTGLGNGAFKSCIFLEHVSLGKGLTSIGAGAFSGCSNLSSDLIIPAGVKTIGSLAFYYCKKLTRMEFLGDVPTSAHEQAFYDCSSLTVYAHEGTEGWPTEGNWLGRPLVMISAPREIISSGYCGETVSWVYHASTGELVISGSGEMRSYGWRIDLPPWAAFRGEIKTLTVTEGVTAIGQNAFF